jgi:hypothetical protein
MPTDPVSDLSGSNQIDGKGDGKECGGGIKSLVNQQLGRLVDDRVGVSHAASLPQISTNLPAAICVL